MKRTLLFAATALVPGMFLFQSTGSSSVAIVDVDRAIQETAGKDAVTKINEFASQQKEAIDKKAKEAQDLETRLRVQDRTLSTAARDQLTKNLAEAQAAVEQMSDDAQKKLDEMSQNLLGPAQTKTIEAINNYASQNSIKVVFDRSILRNGLVYVNDTADITSEIIRRVAANLENPNQKKDAAANLQAQIGHRQWVAIPTFSYRLKDLDRLSVERDSERVGR